MRTFTFTKSKAPAEEYGQLLDDAEAPQAKDLKPTQALVEVYYAALNPADYKLAESTLISNVIARIVVPGQDFAGRIVAVGSAWDRDDLKAGSLCFGRLDILGSKSFNGTLAEYIIAPSDGVAALPEGVDLRSAAGFGCAGMTAFQSIVPHASGLAKGGRVFINGGSGGTGTWGIQVAKAIGLHVTTTCSKPNVELCRSLGADVVLDYKSADVVDSLANAPEKFDFAVDNVGMPFELYSSAKRYLKPGAPIVQVGGEASLAAVGSVTKRIITPSIIAGYKWKFLILKQSLDDLKLAAEWMAQGKLRCVVAEEVDLVNIKEAFATLRGGRTKGKIVIKVSEGTPAVTQ